MPMDPLSQALNDELTSGNSIAYRLLSQKGRQIFFPFKGILGQSAQAKGKTINATIGTAFEEDRSPLILDCLKNLTSLPSSAFLYAPSQGNPALREAWKKQLFLKNPSLQGKNFSLPVVTAALTHALSVAGFLFVDAGDQIIIPDLYWDNYELVFSEAYGSTFKTFNTFQKGGFDLDAFQKALEGPIGKKIVLLNFPNNPTGYTATQEEAQSIARILTESAEAGNEVVVLLDDAYFGLVYEQGVFTESLFTLLADAHQNLLVTKLDGPTKEDYAWGFRVGFMTFAYQGATEGQLKALEAKAAGFVRGSISNAPNISQALLLEAFQNEDYSKQKQEKYSLLQARYAKIQTILQQNPQYASSFEAMPFNSGYFMCVQLKGVDAEAVRVCLLEEFDTGVIVLAGLIRLAFSAVPLHQLEDLFANLHQAVQKVRR